MNIVANASAGGNRRAAGQFNIKTFNSLALSGCSELTIALNPGSIGGIITIILNMTPVFNADGCCRCWCCCCRIRFNDISNRCIGTDLYIGSKNAG